MRYLLYRDDDQSCPVAQSGDYENEFKAIEWAREWAMTQGDHHRYRFQHVDGACPMLLFRTIAGQWYVMPLMQEAAPAD